MNQKSVAILFIFTMLVTGCGQSGPERFQVSGTVSYNGEPLPLGTVMFIPKEGPVSGPTRIDADGKYKLEAVAGPAAVAVTAMPSRPGGRPDPMVEGGIDYTGVPMVQSLIPKKYNRHHSSGINVMVEANERNTIDINLK